MVILPVRNIFFSNKSILSLKNLPFKICPSVHFLFGQKIQETFHAPLNRFMKSHKILKREILKISCVPARINFSPLFTYNWPTTYSQCARPEWDSTWPSFSCEFFRVNKNVKLRYWLKPKHRAVSRKPYKAAKFVFPFTSESKNLVGFAHQRNFPAIYYVKNGY